MSIKRKPKFRHLTQEDRNQIDVLARGGHTLQRIAKKVGCHWCAISRELRRNLSKEHKKYVASIAQVKTINRKSYCVKGSKFDNPILVNYIKNKLKKSWSPEQISGRLKKERPDIHISHESIYQYKSTTLRQDRRV